jgi:hypothetical protein
MERQDRVQEVGADGCQNILTLVMNSLACMELACNKVFPQILIKEEELRSNRTHILGPLLWRDIVLQIPNLTFLQIQLEVLETTIQLTSNRHTFHMKV